MCTILSGVRKRSLIVWGRRVRNRVMEVRNYIYLCEEHGASRVLGVVFYRLWYGANKIVLGFMDLLFMVVGLYREDWFVGKHVDGLRCRK